MNLTRDELEFIITLLDKRQIMAWGYKAKEKAKANPNKAKILGNEAMIDFTENIIKKLMNYYSDVPDHQDRDDK